ncbi:MAG: flagellar hook capping protein [Acidobacteriia bacterium]|nr:flagellar hook capping protein [Terriglobia bacterium]
MDVSSVTNTTAPQSDASANQLTGDSFLTLLVAQLKSQDPTAPTDPTQFVGQLVEFNSLQQLIEIRQTLQDAATATTTTTS